MAVSRSRVISSLSRYGLGDYLLRAIEDFGPDIPEPYLRRFYHDLADRLEYDPLGYIGVPCGTFVTTLTPGFIDLNRADALVRPLVSPTAKLSSLNWALGVPNVQDLLRLSCDLFSSPIGHILFQQFKHYIEAGIAVKTLMQESISREEFSQHLAWVGAVLRMY